MPPTRAPRLRRSDCLRRARFVAGVAVLVVAAPAAAWSPVVQEAIAVDAAKLAPPDLARQLARHADELAAGAREPFGEGRPELHYRLADGRGALDRALAEEVDAAIAAIRERRPFAEVARRLGRIAHWTGDLANPLNAAESDPEERRYYRDFLAYVESARPRFAVVVYEQRPPLASATDVERLVADALARGRAWYPAIGKEYRRIDFGVGARRFDDRSTAFGLAALSYSSAVTDAARLFRHVWIAAGGADPRPVFARSRDRVLLLDHGGAP
jgi:hypothetical protein